MWENRSTQTNKPHISWLLWRSGRVQWCWGALSRLTRRCCCQLQILITLSVLSPAFSAACISRTQKYLHSIHFCHTFHPTVSWSVSQTQTNSMWGCLHPAPERSSSGAARGSSPELCDREWHQAVCNGNTGTPAQMPLLRLASAASTPGKGLSSIAALTCSRPP